MARGRRAMDWQGTYWADQEIGAAPTSFAIVNASTLNAYTQPTITRVIANITCRLDAADQESVQSTDIWAGICCVHEDATPDPRADQDFPWMWTGSDAVWQPLNTRINGNTGASYNVTLGGETRKARFEVDIRSQRRVNTDDELMLIFYWIKSNGTPNDPHFTGHARALIKE